MTKEQEQQLVVACVGRQQGSLPAVRYCGWQQHSPAAQAVKLLWELVVLYGGGWGTDLVGCCRVSVVLLAPTNLSQILQDFFTQGGVSCLEGLLAGCLKALGALMES
jgi:hypothetical protein